MSNNPYKLFIETLFDELVRNKPIPKYQLERRVDIFIDLFLPDILSELFGWDVVSVVPEFPLKKPDSNQSTNLDHLLFRNGDKECWLFFELKTDAASIRKQQTDIYEAAIKRGMVKINEDLQAIRHATKSRSKYDTLIERLEPHPKERPIELVYLAPKKITLDIPVHSITFSELEPLNLPQHTEVWDMFKDKVLPLLTP